MPQVGDEIVIAVDPAATGDERGIVVCGRRNGKAALGLSPYAGWLTPGQPTAWQQAAWEHYDKGVGMSNAESLRLEAERLLERAAKIEALPKEPTRGRYFALDVRFRTGPTVYKYVLVRVPRKKAPALFYATGRSTTGLPWNSVVAWADVESATLTRLRKDRA